MCNCSSKNQKNQTSKEVFEFLTQSDKKEPVGISLFIIPAPEIGIMEYKMVTVEGLTYMETVKRGQMCEVFKFFPYGINMYTDKDKTTTINVNTLDDLRKVYCAHGQYCNGVNCYGTCACLTYSNICYDYGKL